MKRIVKWFLGLFFITACLFLATPTEAAMTEIPAEKTNYKYKDKVVTETTTKSKIIKGGKYYISWAEKTTYPASSGKNTYKTVFYRAASKTGKKIKIATISKRVQFATTDGTFLYFDTGEIPYVAQSGWSDASTFTTIKIWKMRISTGRKRVLATLKVTDKKHTAELEPFSYIYCATEAFFLKTYENYAYFILEYGGGGSDGFFDGVAQIDLKTGAKKTIKVPKTWGSGASILSSKRFATFMGKGRLYYLDMKTGKRYAVPIKATNLGWWYIEGDFNDVCISATVSGNYVYFFESLSEGGARVVRYNMAKRTKKNLTTRLPGFDSERRTPDNDSKTTQARPFKTYAEYDSRDASGFYQLYRYYYESKQIVQIDTRTWGK